MSLVKDKIKLCQTKLSDFNPELINGSPFYNRYSEFVRVLQKNLPNLNVDKILAEPLLNSGTGAIDWYVQPSDEFYISLAKQSGQSKLLYNKEKESLILELKNASSKLQDINEKKYFDCVLKNIENADSDNAFFCDNGNVILGIWGLNVRKGRQLSDVITDPVKDHRVYNITFNVQGSGQVSFPNIMRRHGHTLSGPKDIPNVIPDDRNEHVRWEPCAPQGFTVSEDVVFTAVFEHVSDYLITFDSNDGGHLEGNCNLTLKKGVNLFLQSLPIPIADEGFEFSGWSPVLNQDTLVEEDKHYTALFKKKKAEPVAPGIVEGETNPPVELLTVKFDAGENGIFETEPDLLKVERGSVIDYASIPTVKPNKGYEFGGWDRSTSEPITENTTFHACYNKKDVLPWYKKLWLWFTGKGCLKWLLWLILLLLLLFLLSFLLNSCHGCRGHHNGSVGGVTPIEHVDHGQGVVDDNGSAHPVTGSDGTLPGSSGIVPPVSDSNGVVPPIVSRPGQSDIIANRLFLFLEDESDDIDSFAQDFKNAYPEDLYSIIGFDRDVKSLVIEVPEQERDQIRETINQRIPNHKFFVFDEEIYEINGALNTNPVNPGWHLNAIHLSQGWEITKGDQNIVVAVVDDGIDATHPIFEGKIKDAYNVFTQDSRLSSGVGHGTHTAGLAVGNSLYYNQGASGVAPNCMLMPIQVFDNGRCPLSALISGIMYAVHHDADVINVSIGPSFKGLNQLPIEAQLQLSKEEFKNLERLWARTCSIASANQSVIVLAAGNDDIFSSIPPENRNTAALVVTSVDKNMYPTDFTNYGPCSDISAPGKDIYSSFPESSFASFDGTSMSAPIVSGTIALMKSIKKDINIDQIRNVLLRTGADVYGNIPPMVLVDKALQSVKDRDFSPPSDRAIKPVPEGSGDGSRAGTDMSSPDESIDYDAIRMKIEYYKKQIIELEKLLPNK